MVKATFEFLKPFIIKYPSVSILIVILMGGIFAYADLNANKVSRGEFEAVKKEVNDVKDVAKDIQKEFKYMAQYFTGDTTFNDEIVTIPPREYLVGVNTELFRNKFDSCLIGRVPDSITGKPPYYCWCTDSTGRQKVITFKYPN